MEYLKVQWENVAGEEACQVLDEVDFRKLSLLLCAPRVSEAGNCPYLAKNDSCAAELTVELQFDENALLKIDPCSMGRLVQT